MNRVKFLSKIALAASLSLVLAFTFSCSSDDGDDSFNENSQIYYKDGTAYKGSGVIKIPLYDEDENETLINAGSVTNGIVNLSLPKNIEDKHLSGFFEDGEVEEEEIAHSCTNYSKDIKVTGGGYFVLTSSSGDYISTLAIVYEDAQTYEGIIYAYFSKAGKITCNFEREGIPNFDIDAKAGWNRVYFGYDNNFGYDNSRKEKYSTKNILTKEKNLKWGLYQDY